jgi:hypothetical protein
MRFLVVFVVAARAAADRRFAHALSQGRRAQTNEISHRWFARWTAIVQCFDQTE